MKPNKQNYNNQNERREFKPCTAEEVAGFITRVQNSTVFKRISYTPISASNFVERFVYGFSGTNDRATILYDTKTKKLSYDAKKHIAKILDELYFNKQPTVADSVKALLSAAESLSRPIQIGNQAATDRPLTNRVRGNLNTTKQLIEADDSVVHQSAVVLNNMPAPAFAAKSQKLKIADNLKQKPMHGRTVQLKQKTEPGQKSTVKVPDIIANKKASSNNDTNKKHVINTGQKPIKTAPQQTQQTPTQKAPQKQSPSIPPQFTKQQHTDSIKRLKKLIPNAFDYLSDQAKNDLTIGLIDIFNDRTRLSDYSVLLVPPYRALEKLIYDIQNAQNIEVKMIGQAFEKDDKGAYLLKSGYRKKIDSIVFNEAISALYTEYFIERHNCTHSDNLDLSYGRAVTDLQSARDKFNKLLQIIDYNCKKLKEIQFNI